MIISRKSPLTGKLNTREIEVSQGQIDAWVNGALVQDAMPDGKKCFLKNKINVC